MKENTRGMGYKKVFHSFRVGSCVSIYASSAVMVEDSL
jgi:hypothetical protein